ncbi:6502_t:CDS:2 [Paraglomus occultum]|uniref:6502_t:CDS:1 n=1 Tax=Paraglomus occultum TaxID=144539 RepID=A0A9N8YYM4_9GLOM|nr:6502_t:CDS:2 [Paraglomus occultum]
MTTAARPTFDPARGHDNKAPTLQYSSRDLASHTKLKYRRPGQTTQEEIEEVDLREQLLKAEQDHFEKKRKEIGSTNDVDEDFEAKRQKLLEAAALDADDSDDDSDESEESSEDEAEDEEDDTAELLRELEKIKKERAEERERQEQAAQAEEAKRREEEIAMGNPLLNRDFSVKRRWDDDVIFRNQARGVDDKPKKRFINDTLRSDFHRKFMNKYVK